MPRELIHWCVVDETIDRLKAAGADRTSQAMQRHIAAAYLGAMAPDAPYYYAFGKSFVFSAIAEHIHGLHGNDTFDFLRSIAKAIESAAENEREMLAVFLLGMVTHCIVDATMHPAIFYFTGDYYHREFRARELARARHRLFEVYLDSWIRPQHTFWNRGLLSRTLNALGRSLEIISETLARAGASSGAKVFSEGEEVGHRTRWLKAFRDMSVAQRACYSTIVGAFFRLGAKVAPERYLAFDALSSFRRRESHAFFDESWSYQNPVSGEWLTHTCRELMDSAIAESVDIAVRFEGVFAGTLPIGVPLAEIAGRSLNYGIYGSKVGDAKYYCETTIGLPGL